MVNAEDYEGAVKKYRSRILVVIQRITKHSEDAEDLTQKTLLIALQNLHKFRNESTMYTWLHAIARNTALNYNKNKKYHVDIADTTLISDDSPDMIYEAVDAASRIETALNSMSEGMKKTFELVEIDLVTYKTAAKKMGVPIGTIRSRVHRAKKIINAKTRIWS
jgi:RNA polymerase sigma-70 factor (ECF subfamily)